MYAMDPCTQRPLKAKYLAQMINAQGDTIGTAASGTAQARAIAVPVYTGMYL